MNYTQLKQAIQDYVQSSEAVFLTHIDDFIIQSEQRLARLIRTPDIRSVAYTTIQPGQFFPTTFPFVVSIMGVLATSDGITQIPVLQKEASWLTEAYPSATTQGPPRYYAIYSTTPTATTIRIGPAADLTYTIEVDCFKPPESITTAATSWYGENATDALLYNCLVEAYGFLKGEDDMLKWYKSKADEAVAEVQRMAEGLQKVDTYRNQDIRRPIQ